MIPGWVDGQPIGTQADYGIPKPFYPTIAIHDIELGPAVLSASGGDIASAWWLFIVEGTEVALYKFEGNTPTDRTVLFTGFASIRTVSGTFDQLGRPIVFFSEGSNVFLYWYDPELGDNTITDLGEGSSPHATFDLRWRTSDANSDVLLFYVKNTAVIYRQQRDRYQIEYPTPTVSGASRILSANMLTNYRLQLVHE